MALETEYAEQSVFARKIGFRSLHKSKTCWIVHEEVRQLKLNAA